MEPTLIGVGRRLSTSSGSPKRRLPPGSAFADTFCRIELDREQDDELERADSAVTGYVPGALMIPSPEQRIEC
jgi:hypothetical protein